MSVSFDKYMMHNFKQVVSQTILKEANLAINRKKKNFLDSKILIFLNYQDPWPSFGVPRMRREACPH